MSVGRKKIADGQCNPDCPFSSLFSVSCAESTNAHCQRSQFRDPRQVLWHSYVTIAASPFGSYFCAEPWTSASCQHFSLLRYRLGKLLRRSLWKLSVAD